MRSVALGDTFYAAVGSRAFATGVPEAIGGTPDISCIELDGTNAVIDTGATIAAHGSLTAVNILTIVATSANGYEAGKTYGVVVDTGTVDSVSVVGEVIYEFYVETAAQTAARLFYESVYPTGCVISTTTGNTTGRINLTDVLDAQSTDADQVGKVLTVWDATNGQVADVVITSVQSARLFNVVQVADGSVMDFTVAANDRVWQKDVVSVGSIMANEDGAVLTEVGGDGDHLTALTVLRGVPTTNSAFTFQFTMHDSTDGWSLEPGITVTAEVSKDGAAFAAASGTVTEVEEGVYEFAAAAGDMNCAYGSFKFTGTGCRPTVVNFVTDSGV